MENATARLLLPEDKWPAVETALQAAFGSTKLDDFTLLSGGMSSALVFKLVARGKTYVLRIVMGRDPLNDPVRQYACMNAAAEVGVAPRVYYSSTEDGIAITEFIHHRPLKEYFARREDLLRTMVDVIRTIQSTPLFPPLVNFLDGVDMLIKDFRASGMLPASATEEYFHYYSEIQKVYPRRDPDLVSSHNDLNFRNILFDGRKIWIIDWEVGFRNDRYADLAMVANGFINDPAQEEGYLRAYFGDSLDEEKRCRFFLMQQVCHMFYTMIFMRLAGAQKPAYVDLTMETPSLAEVRAMIGEGLSLDTGEGKLLYGKAQFNQMLRNMKTERFARSIECFRDRAVAPDPVAVMQR